MKCWPKQHHGIIAHGQPPIIDIQKRGSNQNLRRIQAALSVELQQLHFNRVKPQNIPLSCP